ncbi:hypothetical protein GCM10009549_30130 [Streptomyces thermoalcalitolerans]|uniref:Uncharacterized protein n=1 Tax=Streptomyces thermoalcalitolerans TaxID=65605 RepID=A0ABP3Z6Z1_9ACTN
MSSMEVISPKKSRHPAGTPLAARQAGRGLPEHPRRQRTDRTAAPVPRCPAALLGYPSQTAR